MTEPTVSPISVAGIEYEGTRYVAIRTDRSTYALTVDQARSMALILLDVIDEVEQA